MLSGHSDSSCSGCVAWLQQLAVVMGAPSAAAASAAAVTNRHSLEQ